MLFTRIVCDDFSIKTFGEIRIADVLAEIRTDHISNANQKRYLELTHMNECIVGRTIPVFARRPSIVRPLSVSTLQKPYTTSDV
jgi:hypothetical protein